MLTFNEFSGSPYHIGLTLGKFGAAAVHDTVMVSALWEDVMQWRASDQVQFMQQLVQQHHPYIWDELQGLARGLELPPEDVFLWNCRGDLAPVAANESTTCMTLTPEGPRIVHNEQIDPGLQTHCGIAEFIVDHGTAFASYICPGSIAGHAFSVTDKGLAITVNTIASEAPAAGIPSIVLTRALLNASELSSAIQLLNESPRAGNLHLGMMHRGGAALLSIEHSSAEISIQPVKDIALHTNHFVHDAMQEQPQGITETSRQRLDDYTTCLNQDEHSDIWSILTEASGESRLSPDASGPDPESRADDVGPVLAENAIHNAWPITSATANMHAHTDAIHWDVHEHTDAPARFRMQDAKHI